MTYIVVKKEKLVEEKLLPPLSDVSKEVANVLPACVNPLKQEFDDDAGEELDLRRDKDEREVIKCEV